jgi:hypothetical protein
LYQVIPLKTIFMFAVEAVVWAGNIELNRSFDFKGSNFYMLFEVLVCFLGIWQVDRIARVAFEMAQKRQRRLCSVDKANVLEVITSKHCLYINTPNRKRLRMAECVTFEFHKSSAARKITILF